MSIYDYKFMDIDGEEVSLDKYKGKVLIVVNTASKCGFTEQYKDLEALYQQYKHKDFEILGFPCNQFGAQEPGNSAEIKGFCEINYGVTFPLFEKVCVRGEEAHPLFKELSEALPFKSFNMEHKIGGPLQQFIEAKFPHFMEGNSIKWNFTKFLVDKEGNFIERFEPTTVPSEIAPEIEKLI